MPDEKDFISPYVYVGFHCNNNCIFCSEADEYLDGRLEKDFDDIKHEIDLVRTGYDFVNLMGREPTLRKDILSVVSYAKSVGFRQVGLTTNARMLSYAPFAEAIIGSGLNQIGISLLGATAKTHDLLSAAEGSYAQTIEGIKNVMRFKGPDLSVLVNIPLNRKNVSELEDEIDLLISLGVKEINVLWVAPLSRRSRDKELIGRMSELGNHAARIIKNHLGEAKFLMVEFLPCSLKKEYRDMFFPCLEKNPSKIRITLCGGCPYVDKCDGVLSSYIDMYGDEEFEI
ncbi:MAG: radical SAM protein [Candidatus Colwellbacteria bacterium]|nr:radical SAM protein [Candidatus Colwellbacteria bacterium]